MDNKKGGEGCVVSLRWEIRRPKGSEIKSCLSGLTQDFKMELNWLTVAKGTALTQLDALEPILLGAGLMRG